jgi:hypothetical protein
MLSAEEFTGEPIEDRPVSKRLLQRSLRGAFVLLGLTGLLLTVTVQSSGAIPRRAVLMFIIDGLQSDAAKVAMAHGADNIKFLFDNGVWVEEAYCSSPSGRLYLPDDSMPWGTSAPPNVAMHTGTHVFESRQMDDVFLAARRSNIKSVFSGSADNYSVFNTADFCYAVSNTDSIAVDYAIDHLRRDKVRLLSLHVQETRRNWTGPEDKTKPDSKYQRYLLTVDRLLGRLIGALKSEGVWDSTYVIVSSDHGMGTTKESNHPASVVSSWMPYMNFYGPGIKQGQTIPYAETPDLAVLIDHFLSLTPLRGHVDPNVSIEAKGTTGTLLTNIFEGNSPELSHPKLVRRYLESRSWKPSDDFADYRSAMLLLIRDVNREPKAHAAPQETGSRWVSLGNDGKLLYRYSPKGDKIIDFSYAGYMGGGVALPDVPVVRTVKPTGGRDDTGRIQRALDEVSAMPRINGFRGAVLLAPGIYSCAKTLTLWTSGVVLRGSGSTDGGTTIKMVGGKHCAIVIGAAGGGEEKAEGEMLQTTIVDAYVPSGALSFVVAESKGLAVGDTIVIHRPTTAAWLKLMEMDNLKRDGQRQKFIATTRSGRTERRIKAIDGNKITVDVPLSDSYDTTYLNPPGTTVTKIDRPAAVSRVGIERIHIQCPPLEVKYTDAPYSAIRIGGDDCWVRDVFCEETMNSTAITGNRVTMQQVVVKHTYPNLGASKPSDFSIQGCQILIDRCKASGANTYFVWTGSLVSGPNVVLNSSFSGYGSRLQPHQRWATGLLFDNCKVPDGGIDFMNRGVAGSGHGWTMGWGVAWNCLAKTFIIQQPPGSYNWAIGCVGERWQTARLFDTSPILPEGAFESFGKNVAPQSLYLAQLEERLGPQALKNTGYASNSKDLFEDPTLKKLPDLKYAEDPELGRDVAMYRPVNASSVRGGTRKFGAEKALDGNPTTYWATDDSASQPTFEVDMEGPVEISAAEICEANGFEGRILTYKVEGQIDSDWKLLSHGTTVGKRKLDRFPKETVWKVRLTITKRNGYATIKKFGLYTK